MFQDRSTYYPQDVERSGEPWMSEDISWYPPDISGCLRISQDVADRSKHDAAEISGYPRYISGYNKLSQARLGYLGLDQNISEYSKVSQDIFRMSQDISGQIRISQNRSGYFRMFQDRSTYYPQDVERSGEPWNVWGYFMISSGYLRMNQDISGCRR